MRVLVDIGAKRPYTYEAPDGTAAGDAVTVPGPPWAPRDMQAGTVVSPESDYPGPVQRVLGGWPASTHLDWDMSDWGPEDIVVDGIVTALTGCGGNEAQVAVVTPGGRVLRIQGVRRAAGRVEIVVES